MKLNLAIACDDCGSGILVRVEDASSSIVSTQKAFTGTGARRSLPKGISAVLMVVDDTDGNGQPTPGEDIGLWTGGLLNTDTPPDSVELTVGVIPGCTPASPRPTTPMPFHRVPMVPPVMDETPKPDAAPADATGSGLGRVRFGQECVGHRAGATTRSRAWAETVAANSRASMAIKMPSHWGASPDGARESSSAALGEQPVVTGGNRATHGFIPKLLDVVVPTAVAHSIEVSGARVHNREHAAGILAEFGLSTKAVSSTHCRCAGSSKLRFSKVPALVPAGGHSMKSPVGIPPRPSTVNCGRRGSSGDSLSPAALAICRSRSAIIRRWAAESK